MLCVFVFSGEAPKPGISKAMTRNCLAKRSCAGVNRNPPAPCRCTSAGPCPASMYRMRKPSASTNPSRKSLTSNLANVRQDLAAEQVDGAHQRIDIARSRRMQGEVEHAGADLVAAALDLVDDRVRAADKGRRQDPADISGTRFAGDVALVGFEELITQPGADRKRRDRGALLGVVLGLGVGVAEGPVCGVAGL